MATARSSLTQMLGEACLVVYAVLSFQDMQMGIYRYAKPGGGNSSTQNDLGARLYEISLQEVNHFRTCSIPVIPQSSTLAYS